MQNKDYGNLKIKSVLNLFFGRIHSVVEFGRKAFVFVPNFESPKNWQSKIHFCFVVIDINFYNFVMEGFSNFAMLGIVEKKMSFRINY